MLSAFNYKGKEYTVLSDGLILVRTGIVANEDAFAFTSLCALRTDTGINVCKDRFSEYSPWLSLSDDNELTDVEVAMLLINKYTVQ